MKNEGIKKVLGVHGWTSSGIQNPQGKWLPIQEKLKAA
jgi:hypothetical protein